MLLFYYKKIANTPNELDLTLLTTNCLSQITI